MARLRYSFDLGTNSIGWAVFRCGEPDGSNVAASQPQVLLAAGVRIFSDGRNPKDGSSLAMMRRGPRAARRRRDRFLQRQRKLIKLLIAHGLMPAPEGERKRLERLDPYELRLMALDQRIELFQLGRAIFHINQRRGFLSNRKTDRTEKEASVLKQAQIRLEEAVTRDGSRTLGEFLHKRLCEGSGARFRIRSIGPKAEHEFYPTRKLMQAEFDAIWRKQSDFHPETLTEKAKGEIENAIFHQRPLRKVKAGRCTFNPGEERLPAALPSVQARRVYQELNELRYGEGLILKTPLTREERDLLAGKLLSGQSLTWVGVRKALKLDAGQRFSLEDSRKGLEGCPTAAALKGKRGREIFGERWAELPLSRQDEIVWQLLENEDEESLVDWLSIECGLSAETAMLAAQTALVDGHASLGTTANVAVLKQLVAHPEFTYSKAAEAAGYHHSDFRTKEKLKRLPYYAVVLERHVSFGSGDPADPEEIRYGRIANPTVHIGLNQLRRIVNRLIAAYGPPDEVVVELARELKLNKKQKDEEQLRNSQNRATNERYKATLAENGLPDTAGNLMMLRLWEEQRDGMHSFCPYSGAQISLSQLFSAEVEIDHILPFSRTLDDSSANKVVCFRSSNRGKGNRTPYEFYGSSAIWSAIEENARKLPRNKSWRFAADAMERFKTEGGDFLDRQLNETRHLSRIAKSYLEVVAPQVWVVTGTLTAMLRGKWGLNSILEGGNRKNRDDHRHHAIDAFTVGCISRGLLSEISRRAGRAEDLGDPRVLADLPEPFVGFRDEIRDALRSMVVSHKPEHGKGGALHEETAYGIVKDEEERKIGNLVRRKALTALTSNEIDQVRDPVLQKQLAAIRDQLASEGKDAGKHLASALAAWAEKQATDESSRSGTHRNPIRHVRLLKPEASSVEILPRQGGAPYKALVPGQNWCMDIVSVPDGRGGYIWKGFEASVFEVNQKGWRPVWEREKLGGKLVMRLHKGDLIELEEKSSPGLRTVKRVVRINPSASRLYLAGHFDGGDLQKRHDDSNDAFRWDLASISGLKERGALKRHIDEVGMSRPGS